MQLPAPFRRRTAARENASHDVAVLFVCMGNICRSPTAETVFREHVKRAGLERRIRVESAGIGDWHVGQPPDERAIAHGRRRGYDLEALRARQVRTEDFARFEWILAMDRRNLRDLALLRPADFQGHLGLLLDFAPELGVREVPDPYFGGADGFEKVLELTERASAALLARIVETHRLT
jgi:protein-tyrosine phosphatase